jgi:hypothetical protein
MFDTPDERGTSGLEVCARALQQAGGGGTLALNIPGGWQRAGKHSNAYTSAYGWLARAQKEQGWVVSPVATLADLLGFAREFSRRHYGDAVSL